MSYPFLALAPRRAIGTLLFLITQLAPVGNGVAGLNTTHYQYLSPMPGSKLVSPENNIIVRFGGKLDASSIDTTQFAVTGTESGVAAGSWATCSG